MWLELLAPLVVGYLIGSIPVGYLAGKAWGVDVRKYGSGRTGGTNVWRATNSVVPAILTALGDIAKGAIAVLLGRYLFGAELAAALAGAAAVLGHNWSIMLGFRGGAGGITGGSALVILSPVAGIVVAPTALILLYLSRYASVATLTVGVGSLVMLTLLALLASNSFPWAHVAYGVVVGAAILWALRPNLKRLAEGTERRITLW